MHRILVLALALLVPAWLQGQQANPSKDTSTAPAKASGLATLEGCLQSVGGNYTLTESNGTVHHLTYSSKLNHHAGQEVQVTGKLGVKTVSDTSYGAASSAELTPIFEVKTVTHVADTCKSPGK